jgi:hypothetical protein
MQSVALQITAGLLLVLTAVFVWVLLNTKGEQPLEKVAAPAYRLRMRLFLVASVSGLVIAVARRAGQRGHPDHRSPGAPVGVGPVERPGQRR